MSGLRMLVVGALVVACGTAQQANSPGASMVINSVGGSPLVGPFVVQTQVQANMSMVFSSSPLTPFTVFNANPSFGGGLLAPGLATPFGTVNIGPVAFPPIEIVLDGINNPGNILGALAMTGTTGSTTFTITVGQNGVPCGSAASVLGNLQTLFLSPASPSPVLSAATSVVFAPTPLPDTAPVDVLHCDDCWQQVTLAGCNSFTFFGTAYTSLYVGSNGYITFGGGDSSLGENQATFNSGLPRISVFWDDLYPVAVGTLTKYDDGTSLTVSWNACPEFAFANQNTFAINLDYATGTITMTYGAVAAQDGMCGITRGGSLASPVSVFSPTSPLGTIVSHLGANAYVGGALESMNELWSPPTTTFNLANQVVHFTPNNPTFTAYTLY